MKTHKIYQRSSLLLLTILLVGCMKLSERTVTPSIVAPTLLIAEALETGTVTPMLTHSPDGTSTVTSISTHSPTGTLTPSFTVQTIPTLTTEDAYKKLLDLLENNGGCRLPCLWGIIPAKSTSNDAMSILFPLSGIAGINSFSPNIGTINLRLTLEDGLNINISVVYLSKNNIVNQIAFSSEAYHERKGGLGLDSIFNSTIFGDKLRFYMLPNILSEFGRPSSVMITSLAQPPSQSRGGDIGYFRVLLLYPEQGILIHYITQINNIGQNVVGCLTNAHVELDIYPPGVGGVFFQNIDPSTQEDIKNNYKPIEDVTTLTMEDFYQAFRQPTDKCIETPANLWTIPEP